MGSSSIGLSDWSKYHKLTLGVKIAILMRLEACCSSVHYRYVPRNLLIKEVNPVLLYSFVLTVDR